MYWYYRNVLFTYDFPVKKYKSAKYFTQYPVSAISLYDCYQWSFEIGQVVIETRAENLYSFSVNLLTKVIFKITFLFII